jgi:hypothetical protein
MNDVTALVLAIPSTVDIILSKNTVYAYKPEEGSFIRVPFFSQNFKHQ